MKFYVIEVDGAVGFDICVEAESEEAAKDLALDEAKKRVRSFSYADFDAWGVKESDEK